MNIVEQTLSKMSEHPSKNRLWRALPSKIPYTTFESILDQLEESNKILYDKDGAIIWIYASNSKLKKLLRTSKSLS